MKKKRVSLNIDMPHVLMLTVIIVLTAGVCAGAVFAGVVKPPEYNKIMKNISINLESGREHSPSNVFKDAVYKYGKYAVFIWFFGFVQYGAVMSLCVLAVKGTGLGFTSGIILREFGLAGISQIAELYLLQNLILLPTYLFMAYYSVAFAIKKKERISDIPEYFLVLALGGAAIVLACLMETFFVR